MTLQDWLNTLERSQRQTDPPAPVRCAEILKRLGFKKFCPVITIGGTNGKGSTTHLLSAYLQALGKKVGRFTSPHLIHYNERIAINAVAVSRHDIVDAFEKIKAVQEELELGYFDYSLLAALLIFAEAGVDWIVLEVGLGGRFDATNCLDTDCAVITTIHFDHTEVLGHDRESIGFEKSGIMRRGQPAVCGDANPPVSLIQHAKEIGAQLILTNEQNFKIDLPPTHFPKQNAYTALIALQALEKKGLLIWNETLFCEQVAKLVIPGRMQILPGRPEIIVDVAHNQESVEYLVDFLKSHPCEGATSAVFSVLKDKALSVIMQATHDCFTEWNLIELDSPRALPLEVLVSEVKASGVEDTQVYGFRTIEKLMASIQKRGEVDRVVVFGSVLIASLFLKWYNAQK